MRDEPERIRRFLSETDGSVGTWVEKPNGQMLLRTPTVAVSFYTTKGRTLWQGKLGSRYEQDYQRWRGSQNGSTAGPGKKIPTTKGPPSATSLSYSYGGFTSAPRASLTALPNKGQKSTQNECEEFLREMELGSSGDIGNLWETKPNGQLLAHLWRVGRGNMSFYTTTGTLLFQGRDQAGIKSAFYNWRQKRMQLLEKEFIDNESSFEKPARKRLKVEGKSEGKPSIGSMKIAAMTQELHSYGESTVQFLERSEFEAALDAARQASEAEPEGKCGDRTRDSYYSYSCPNYQSDNEQPPEEECEDCNRPMSKHKFFHGEKVCVFSGKYKCNCGRWWRAMALKLQHKAPNDDGAFPPHTFPDCKKCEDNSTVVLLEHMLNDSSRDRTGAGHQYHLCKMCQAGQDCPRANRF